MKKALILASVASMIDQFNMSNIEILKELGYQVDVVANFQHGSTTSQERVNFLKNKLISIGIQVYDIGIERNVMSISNLNAYKQIKKLIKKQKYNLIHCQSPVGGVLTRLAARKARKNGTKVIYTAHGFHFFKGAPLKNWLLFYPIERFCARFTDVLITINQEDYDIAQKFKANKVVYVPGVGVDTKKFSGLNVDRDEKRKKLGILENQTVLLSVGELSKRKNHEVVIKALAKLNNPNIVYLICGKGDLDKYLNDKANELNVNVKFLGFRKDISEISLAADVFVFPSLQEGLPVALMEAMSAGLPVVCSKIRGNIDLIEEGKGGYLVEPDDADGFAKSINKAVECNKVLMEQTNKRNMKNFDISKVKEKIIEIYSRLLGE